MGSLNRLNGEPKQTAWHRHRHRMATPLIISTLQDAEKDSRGVPLIVMGRGGEYEVEDAEGPQELTLF